jgi:hypothetical protein
MLVGFGDSLFEVGRIDRGQFFISSSVLYRPTNQQMEIMAVYGPANHSRSGVFLEEISAKVAACTFPLVLGGDFNLIHHEEDKNNDRINWARMAMFNEHIANWALREIPRTVVRYTWTNKQLNPIRCVLDRVFISPQIDLNFPLCTLAAETSLGSDDTPLIFDSGEGSPARSNRFFFETGWFAVEGFLELVQSNWERLAAQVQGRDIIDWWNFMSAGLRRQLKGWKMNSAKAARAQKEILLGQIKELDSTADSASLEEEEWAFRY